MKKQYFKSIDEQNNVFDISDLRIQVVDDKPYKFSDSFKPNVYEYEIIDNDGNSIYKYRGKSFCGSSGRFCDHTTHSSQDIDKVLAIARENDYLVKIRCLDVCGSMAEMDAMEGRRIHEMMRDEYNNIMSEETNYSSYSFAKNILNERILNKVLI